MTQDPADATATPPPTFDVLPLSRELRQAIDELGYTHPTPVQREVFEPASRGRDIVVQARTGTGKTAAFGLPVVDALVQRNLAAVQVIILCPTRELALQVHREIDTLGRYRGVKSVAVYGGAPMMRQIEELAAGAQVLAGTPGRVLDHLRRGSLDPSAVRVFVLDESDEMLSMGFLPQINEILGYLPAGHQSLLFSATLPPDIQRHAETRLRDPLFLTLSGDQIGALDIQHLVYMSQGDKLKDFIQVLEVENPESAIVFCNTRDETKRVAAALDRLGYAADWLNADLAQNEREKVMAATRRGDLRFLVCTDVAARGIDISHLTHVINFDLPESAESYVHRTGRTGRAGRTGTAISLIEPSDIGNLYMLRLIYKIFPIERQLPTAGELRTRQELDVVTMFEAAFANRRVHPDDLSLARRLMTHDAAEQIIACLLHDHLGARPEAVREATEARRAKGPPNTTTSINVREPTPKHAPAPKTDAAPPPPAPHRDAGSPGRRDEPRRDEPRRDEPRRDESRRDEPRRGEAPGGGASPSPSAESREGAVGAGRGQVAPGTTPRGSGERAGRRQQPQDRRARQSGGALEPKPEQIYRDDDFEFAYSVSEPASELVDQSVAPAVAPVTDTVAASAEVTPTSAHAPTAASESELPTPTDGGTTELFVNVGRVDGATVADFQRLLEQAGVSDVASAAINLRRNHCFVRVPTPDFPLAEAALNGRSIAGKLAFAERSRSNRA